MFLSKYMKPSKSLKAGTSGKCTHTVACMYLCMYVCGICMYVCGIVCVYTVYLQDIVIDTHQYEHTISIRNYTFIRSFIHTYILMHNNTG